MVYIAYAHVPAQGKVYFRGKKKKKKEVKICSICYTYQTWTPLNSFPWKMFLCDQKLLIAVFYWRPPAIFL